MTPQEKKHHVLQDFLYILKGILVGFGAILPGISGGALCAAFGVYKPIIEVLSRPRSGILAHWRMLIFFVLGGAVGFVGLSGFANYLMVKNSAAVTCAFFGFILGTLPGLWKDAGKQGRSWSSYLSLLLGFLLMTCLLLLLRYAASIQLKPNVWGFLLCGVLWGISFIVPGLSSSTLLLFFGLYQPMLDGISKLSPQVLLPLMLGAAVCLLTLPRGVRAAYRRFDSVMSHAVLGIVIATSILILPSFRVSIPELTIYLLCIVGGTCFSWIMGKICDRLDPRNTEDNNAGTASDQLKE